MKKRWKTPFYFVIGVVIGVLFALSLSFASSGIHPKRITSLSSSSSLSSFAVYDENVNERRLSVQEKPVPRVLKDKEWLHTMNDQELLREASSVSYSASNSPKVAFFVSNEGGITGGLQLSPLWEMFFKGYESLYSIYVHACPNYNVSTPESSVFHGRRIPSAVVQWGWFNMLEAERRLLANALLDPSNQRFVLISESTIPLFNFSTIYTHLTNSTKSFVEVYDLPGSVGRGRYNRKMSPDIQLRDWRKGSQWFEMDRALANQIISDHKYFPSFEKYCKTTNCIADEHYIPTFVNMKFPNQSWNRGLTWVDWSENKPHPRRFIRRDVTVDLLHQMRSGTACEYNGEQTNICFLFARKFLPNTLNRLLLWAPKLMGFNQ